MGFLDKLVVGGMAALVGGGVVLQYRSAQETKHRRSTPIVFDDRLSQRDFDVIARRIGERLPRVSRVTTAGADVHLEVRSNSGLSTWTADIDFYDYGRLTGNYWIQTANTQSPIPELFAHQLQDEIRKRGGR